MTPGTARTSPECHGRGPWVEFPGVGFDTPTVVNPGKELSPVSRFLYPTPSKGH